MPYQGLGRSISFLYTTAKFPTVIRMGDLQMHHYLATLAPVGKQGRPVTLREMSMLFSVSLQLLIQNRLAIVYKKELDLQA